MTWDFSSASRVSLQRLSWEPFQRELVVNYLIGVKRLRIWRRAEGRAWALTLCCGGRGVTLERPVSRSVCYQSQWGALLVNISPTTLRRSVRTPLYVVLRSWGLRYNRKYISTYNIPGREREWHGGTLINLLTLELRDTAVSTIFLASGQWDQMRQWPISLRGTQLSEKRYPTPVQRDCSEGDDGSCDEDREGAPGAGAEGREVVG